MTTTSPYLQSQNSLGVPDARQLQYRRNRHHVVISSSRTSEFWVLNSKEIVSVFLSSRERKILLRLGFINPGVLHVKAILIEMYRKKLPSYDYDDIISTGVVESPECLPFQVFLPA